MVPDDFTIEKGLIITTGSTLKAEYADRPLAYELKKFIETVLEQRDPGWKVLVLSDLWYLNAEHLKRLPLISIGGPSVNAVSAHLYKCLTNVLVIDNTLLIQMDPHLEDLRVSVWGCDHANTKQAIDLFMNRGYLERFLDAAMARMS